MPLGCNIDRIYFPLTCYSRYSFPAPPDFYFLHLISKGSWIFLFCLCILRPPPPGSEKVHTWCFCWRWSRRKGGGALFRMRACCNLIGKAVPIVQVSVGPYRLSSIQTSLVSATLEIKSKSLLSHKVPMCGIWRRCRWRQCPTLSTPPIIHMRMNSWQTRLTYGAYKESNL